MDVSVRRSNSRPHAVCVPFPAQGHMNPMLNIAKLLHHKGFHITFVNTDFNHNRILRSQGPDSLKGLPSFQFVSIPDGLPPSDADSTQDIGALIPSIIQHGLAPLRDLILKLNTDHTTNNPPVTCIVSDVLTSFTLDVSQHFGIPNALLWVMNASSFIAYLRYSDLIQKGILPLKDLNLDTVVDWMPELEGIRLKNLPSFIALKEGDNFVKFQYTLKLFQRARSASAIILNTFDDVEDQTMMGALSSILPPVYTIGPAHHLVDKIPYNYKTLMTSNLWKEDMECLRMLDSKEPNSVIYVNFGSLLVMTSQQVVELAWGLANSKKNFFWVIRPGFVQGEDAILPPEFVEETKERGFMTNWCPQEQVLRHPSIAGYLTHCGWNSTLECLSAGVPIISWPIFSDQPTNSWSCCKWGVGMEIDGDISRDKIEKVVVELMDAKKGKEMKMRAMELKRMIEEAVGPKGSSQLSLDKLITEVLL